VATPALCKKKQGFFARFLTPGSFTKLGNLIFNQRAMDFEARQGRARAASLT
jgi:hypothetical protein